MLWHLHSASGRQTNPSRPSLIDLGPLALLQTALTLLAAPLLRRQRMGSDIASVLLSLPILNMWSLISTRKSRGLHTGFVFIQKHARWLVWQTLPIVTTIYAYRTSPSEPSSKQRSYDSCVAASGPADRNIPAFPLKAQCQCCLQKKHIVYDAHGYPLFLQ